MSTQTPTHKHQQTLSLLLQRCLSLLYFMIGLCCIATASQAHASDGPRLKITIHVVDGTGDDPMIVLWAENRQGFAKTLYWFSKDHEWYPDLTGWDKKRSDAGIKNWKDEAGIDAVMGPTIPWGSSKSCLIPIKQESFNLLDGTYRLRIEQCKDKGGHYKNFKIPLRSNFAGGELNEANGYISSIKIEVIK